MCVCGGGGGSHTRGGGTTRKRSLIATIYIGRQRNRHDNQLGRYVERHTDGWTDKSVTDRKTRTGKTPYGQVQTNKTEAARPTARHIDTPRQVNEVQLWSAYTHVCSLIFAPGVHPLFCLHLTCSILFHSVCFLLLRK